MWVLLVSINPGGPFGGSATQYFVGDFDGKTFTCESRPEQVKWMDYGKDHYATVSWSGVPDGRHIAMAWMSNWQYANEVPTKQFRSANALPRDLSLYRDEETGECFLSVLPVKEVESLRLFLDRCSLEAFEADGRMVMTNLLFPNKPYTMLSVYTESGSTRVRSLDIYEITGK